jgi:thiol:disulfide interchange protein
MKLLIKKSYIKNSLVAMTLLALGATAYGTQAAPSTSRAASSSSMVAARGVRWQPSWAAAFKEAKRTGKPVFVDFYATWCGPCKMLDQHVYTDRRFINASRKWVMLKVDVERNTKLAERQQISGFPTLVYYAPTTRVIARKVGFSIDPKYQTSERAAIGELKRQMVSSLNWAHKQAQKRPPIKTGLHAS